MLSRMTPDTHPEDPIRVSEALPEVHLVLGPVGAGKSTFARALSRERRAVRLTLDEWMTTLFRPDRPDHGVAPWYVERSARCIEQIWTVAEAVLGSGTTVVLELGLLTRRERESFYERVTTSGVPLTVHVVDAARAVRRERVAERNRVRGPTFSMPVPPEIFELASDRWEEPDASECEGRTVRFLRTDRASGP
jgi:predicted kinase